MLKALDMLYLAKALLNRFYLKQKLYGFKMSESLSIESNIDEFLHLITDLENIDVQVADEDQAILLLMSLPRQFDQLRDTLRYGTGRTTLTLDEVVAAIYAKELENGSNSKGSKGEAESLYVREKGDQRGRSDNRDINSRSKSRSKSRGRKVCWSCGEEGHFRVLVLTKASLKTNQSTRETTEKERLQWRKTTRKKLHDYMCWKFFIQQT